MMPKLYIICGHGAGDPGACAAGQTEEERVRALAAVIKERGGADVEVLDTSRNWYADGGINSLTLPKDAMLLELHRDSAAESARGAHVIIYAGFEADDFDKALAAKLSAILPGRSQTIVKRGDLANPKRAAKRGINYRLAEVGFISNAEDRAIFDSQTDEIARAILEACGIEASAPTDAPSDPATPTQPTGGIRVYGFPTVSRGSTGNAVKMMQAAFNVRFGYSLAVDGSCGPASSAAIVDVQTRLGLDPDGYCGPLTWQAILTA